MRTFLIIACASLALACTRESESPPAAEPAAEAVAEAPAVQSSAAEFQLDGGNIGCFYTPAGGTDVYETADGAAELKCDRIEPSYTRIVLPEHGASRVEDTQERGCCAGEMLTARTHWSAGPFQCGISEVDLACANGEGHEFVLGREQADVR